MSISIDIVIDDLVLYSDFQVWNIHISKFLVQLRAFVSIVHQLYSIVESVRIDLYLYLLIVQFDFEDFFLDLQQLSNRLYRILRLLINAFVNVRFHCVISFLVLRIVKSSKNNKKSIFCIQKKKKKTPNFLLI